eukprot:5683606-Prymnesium_polylepis.1
MPLRLAGNGVQPKGCRPPTERVQLRKSRRLRRTIVCRRTDGRSCSGGGGCGGSARRKTQVLVQREWDNVVCCMTELGAHRVKPPKPNRR